MKELPLKYLVALLSPGIFILVNNIVTAPFFYAQGQDVEFIINGFRCTPVDSFSSPNPVLIATFAIVYLLPAIFLVFYQGRNKLQYWINVIYCSYLSGYLFFVVFYSIGQLIDTRLTEIFYTGEFIFVLSKQLTGFDFTLPLLMGLSIFWISNLNKTGLLKTLLVSALVYSAVVLAFTY